VPPAGTSFVAGSTAAVPRPRFVRAVGALTRSERFDALASFESRLAWRSTCAESVPVMLPQVVEVTGVTPPTLTTQAAYVPEPVLWFTSTVITPVPELYVSTSPCIWFAAS
jgi:hypothetical protein